MQLYRPALQIWLYYVNEESYLEVKMQVYQLSKLQ